MQVQFKIEENSGHIHVPIYVNETGPYYFTLDTGAGLTTVSKALIEKLGMPLLTDDKIKAAGVGGSVSVMKSSLNHLRIGSEVLENENVAVLDFESIFGPMWTSSGLIGHSILKNFRVTIDYKDSTISLKRNQSFRSEGDHLINWVPFKYLEDTHIIIVPVHINKKGPYDFILDTGSSGTILSPNLVTKLGLDHKSSETTHDHSSEDVNACGIGECPGVGGVAKGYTINLDQLSIKSAIQENPTVGVIDLKLVSPKNLKLNQGIIGYPFLKNFKVILDFPNKRVGIIKQKRPN